MKTLTALSALALTLGFAGAASAQDAPARDDADITYSFADDHVDGDYRRPLGERLNVRGRAGRNTLVRPRAHYVPELLKSVERL